MSDIFDSDSDLGPEGDPVLDDDAVAAALIVEPVDAPEEADFDDGPRPLTDSEIHRIVYNAVEDTVDFVEVEISPSRQKAQKYYNGGSDLGHEPGRSGIVAARVADVIRQVRPSIMRVLLQAKNPIEFQPRGEEDVSLADDATTACNFVLMEQNNGYKVLYDAVTDAMLKRVGIVKVWWDETDRLQQTEYTGLTDVGLSLLDQDPDVEITQHMARLDGTGRWHDVTATRRVTDGRISIACIPPEEFYVDQDATYLDDGEESCRIAIHRRDVRVGDLVAMGFDYDDVVDLDSGEEIDSTKYEDDQRRGYIRDESEGSDPANDPMSKRVLLTECWMRLDADGDGVAELRHFMCGGTACRILLDEPVDMIPLADFRTEIEPHAFYPRSLAEITMIDQDQATVLMRSILDNAQMTNAPRLVVNENAVTLEDALNGEIGGVIRATAPGQVSPLNIPFTAGQTLPVMEYLDKMLEAKTGVTQLSAGLSPDALQSTAAVAVNAQVQAAQANAELMARNIAEGGMTRLARLILKMLSTHQDKAMEIRIGDEFAEIDPRFWHTQMDVRVNVGLGTGQVTEKLQTLAAVAGKQETIVQAMGPVNPFASWENLRNTYAEMLRLSGFMNVSDFFPPVDPQQLQQMMQAQQGEGDQADPSQALLGAEQIKAQASLAGKQLDAQVDLAKARMQDDRERDADEMDFAVKTAEIGARYGADVNKAAVQAAISRPRTP